MQFVQIKSIKEQLEQAVKGKHRAGGLSPPFLRGPSTFCSAGFVLCDLSSTFCGRERLKQLPQMFSITSWIITLWVQPTSPSFPSYTLSCKHSTVQIKSRFCSLSHFPVLMGKKRQITVHTEVSLIKVSIFCSFQGGFILCVCFLAV